MPGPGRRHGSNVAALSFFHTYYLVPPVIYFKARARQEIKWYLCEKKRKRQIHITVNNATVKTSLQQARNLTSPSLSCMVHTYVCSTHPRRQISHHMWTSHMRRRHPPPRACFCLDNMSTTNRRPATGTNYLTIIHHRNLKKTTDTIRKNINTRASQCCTDGSLENS